MTQSNYSNNEKFILVGNLGKDAEQKTVTIKNTGDQRRVVNFPLAVNRRTTSGGKEANSVKWYHVAVWTNNQEEFLPFLKKGAFVEVVGIPVAKKDKDGNPVIDVNAYYVSKIVKKSDEADAGEEVAIDENTKIPDNKLEEALDSDDLPF